MKLSRNWVYSRELNHLGVLGINARNSQYILPFNQRKLYPLADDKSLTKRICISRGIPTPKTYAIIERYGDIRRFKEIIGDLSEFVIKPARGSAGRGILPISGRNSAYFYHVNGNRLSYMEICYHISTTWSGLYSIGGRQDNVIIEELVKPHSVFHNIFPEGTPDIRIITYKYKPVMSMVRLPTRLSKGRANLTQGAAAVGINLHTGKTQGGVWNSKNIKAHPDTGAPLKGINVPFWTELLKMAADLSRAIGLVYLGIDCVLDKNQGPLILEANTRPGLDIQLANQYGIKPFLEAITNDT